jgi:hypothetical protein
MGFGGARQHFQGTLHERRRLVELVAGQANQSQQMQGVRVVRPRLQDTLITPARVVELAGLVERHALPQVWLCVAHAVGTVWFRIGVVA